MRISTDMGMFRAIGDCKKIIKTMKDAGFDAYDCSFFMKPIVEVLKGDTYLEWGREFRAYADAIGIVCNQSHAPFPTERRGDKEYNERLFPLIVHAIEVSAILGAKVCIVHPCQEYTAEENAEMFKRFEPYARKAGVKIALENLYGAKDGQLVCAACSPHENYIKHLSLLPADVFTACLDVGHAEILGEETSAVQMIEALGDRLTNLHLHDVDKRRDSHFLPFTLKVEFEPIIEALKKVGYQGDITLETAHFADKMPVELMPSVAKLMADVADYFRRRIQN